MVRVVLMAALRAYRLVISPLYGQVCRYYPSCSAYALEAVDRHGALRGSWLAMRRLGRCHPWCAGGVDLVPDVEHYRWWGLAAGSDGETTSDDLVSDIPDTIPSHSTQTPAASPPGRDVIVA
jgi:uncharacterized protein